MLMVLAITMALLAACGGAPVPQSSASTVAPAASGAPTAPIALAPTAAPGPTVTTAATAAPATTTTASTTAIQFVGHTGEVHGVAFSPDGKYVATAAYDRTAALWDAATGKQVRVFSGHTQTVETVTFSPDGKLLLTASEDKTIRLWDIATGQIVHVFKDNEERIDSASFSPDGKAIAGVVEAQSVKIWEVASGKVLLTISQPNVVISAAFAPDGKHLVTGGLDHIARLWDVATGQQVQTFSGHSNNIGALQFSPDSKYLLTGSDDGTACIWDVATGQTVRTLAGQSAAVVAVAYSPDGKVIATGSDDHTAWLWDAATGQAIGVFTGHSGTVHGVAFSPDGRQLATGSFDKTGRMWQVQEAAPAPVTSSRATSETVVSTTAVPLADTNPEKPNDATQGRLRISNCVFDGPSVDMLLNGKLTVNGGVTQANLGALNVGGYQYLTPGTYSVAIVPTGQGIDKALLGPLDVPIAAGHRYTLVMLGQADEKQHTPLVIDETEAYQKAGLTAGTWGEIAINNVKNSTSLSFIQDGAGVKDVPYGGFAAAAMPAGTFKDFKVTISGAGKPDIEDNGAGFGLPGSDQLDCFAGIYPNGHDTHTAATISPLNTIDFLQVTSDGFAKVGHPESGFTSFLAALKTAGLTEELAQGGPYLIFAPTDAAFAALPKDKRDALMADPQALVDLIHTHLIEGYFPYGTMGPIGQGFNRTVTNMRGEQLKVTGDDSALFINGQSIGETSGTFVANGTRVMSVPKLLLPDAK
jgi:WD40 repeat protein/uncharacterized surface protein with fasciclin (FAS1) repeats